jgi:hypothetical protein
LTRHDPSDLKRSGGHAQDASQEDDQEDDQDQPEGPAPAPDDAGRPMTAAPAEGECRDMLPTPEGGGLSDYARPSGPRERLTGLPGPQNGACRVFLAVQHQAAGRTDVGAHRQAPGSWPPAADSGCHRAAPHCSPGWCSAQASRSPTCQRMLLCS